MAAECRNYLMQVIGLATVEQANAVRDEGLATLDDFTSFDDDDIKSLIPASMLALRGDWMMW